MTRKDWIILCLAYIVGLLSTNLLGFSTSTTLRHLCLLAIGLIGAVAICAIALRKVTTTPRIWIGAAMIAILAVLYFQLRIPQPKNSDISYQITASDSGLVTVAGKVLSEPRLNDSQRLKFQLEVTEINHGERVSGKLYATVPLLQGTGIYPGQQLKLKGLLYLPQAASNPAGFDFKQYLARQGIFAGIRGFEVIFGDRAEPAWGWWKIRQRIVRSHLRGLGSPRGQLVSSMVLGRKAVDLPAELRDRFIKAGLAHVLAASGFHVSLLLGIILKLTERFAAKPRLAVGIGTLVMYLGLTGIQASVFRACLMGSAVLIALTMETKVKPLGSLLLAATIILLFNPLFISDLGFQLSFLATLGLIVTLPGLQAKLDWLPPTIATLVAVPLAASIWVLPLLGYVFNAVATYSIIVNILCTPLVTVISLGGMISAIAALIFPAVGSAIAWLLLYPTLLLLTVTKFFTSLPGSTWAIGQISLSVLLLVYGLLLLVWLNKWCSKHWGLILIFAWTLIIIPAGYKNFNQTQVTVFPTQPTVVVIQDRGKVILIDSGDSNAVKYSVLPFLTQQGINHLDFAIEFNQTNSDWEQIRDRLSIKHLVTQPDLKNLFVPNSQKTLQTVAKAITTDSFQISFEQQLSALKLETATEIWLILSKLNRSSLPIQQYIQDNFFQKQIVLIGSSISPSWLRLQPQTVISTNQSKPIPRQSLKNIQFYNLKQDGAIAWTPKDKFQPTQRTPSRNNNF
ncbi:ComEC/Rec2 family competence protein [Pleurocapsales cyanobacterium LEGE 10410]|nr:ComEC/Rec2 family competence protein [Pleurocapsales cyanobacterium LEGE 10410]